MKKRLIFAKREVEMYVDTNKTHKKMRYLAYTSAFSLSKTHNYMGSFFDLSE